MTDLEKARATTRSDDEGLNARVAEALQEERLLRDFAHAGERIARWADAESLIAWLDDPDRKPAAIAFTAGLERQIALRFELK